jgi:hypothetical protein
VLPAPSFFPFQREVVRQLQSGLRPTIDVPLPPTVPVLLCVGDRVLGAFHFLLSAPCSFSCAAAESFLTPFWPPLIFVAKAIGCKGLLSPGMVLALSAADNTYRSTVLAARGLHFFIFSSSFATHTPSIALTISRI